MTARAALLHCWTASAFLACGATSQSFSDSESRESARPRAQVAELTASTSFALWDDAIDVCFVYQTLADGGILVPLADGGLFPVDYSSARNSIMAGLHGSWEAASAVVFNDVGLCGASPPAAALKLTLSASMGPGSGICGYGKGTTCTVSIADVEAPSQNRVRVALHEVGHALGFVHEHQRELGGQYEYPLCGCEAIRKMEAEQVILAGAPMTFSADSCWGAITLTVSVATQWLSDRTAVATRKLTQFDTESLMNYCRTDESMQLSALDALGAEMLYPRTFVRTITPVSGPAFSVSGGVVTRTDSPVRFSTEWTARGGLAEYQASTTWTTPGESPSSDAIYERTWANGTQPLDLTFVDLFNRTHTANTTILADDAMYTSILASVIF